MRILMSWSNEDKSTTRDEKRVFMRVTFLSSKSIRVVNGDRTSSFGSIWFRKFDFVFVMLTLDRNECKNKHESQNC